MLEWSWEVDGAEYLTLITTMMLSDKQASLSACVVKNGRKDDNTAMYLTKNYMNNPIPKAEDNTYFLLTTFNFN